MTATLDKSGGRQVSSLRIAAWSAAALVLLLPLIAMQFTDEVVWPASDFAIFGVMLAVAGGSLEFAARKTGDFTYRYAVGFAVAAAFLLLWVNGAVGIIGSDDNVANRIYDGVLAVGLLGAVIARFRPRGMSYAMFATAGAQVLAFVIALVAGWGHTGPITIFFTALWLASAFLFRRAASEATPDRTADED